MNRERIIIAVHGILTPETSRSWHQRFKAYVWKNRAGVDLINRE